MSTDPLEEATTDDSPAEPPPTPDEPLPAEDTPPPEPPPDPTHPITVDPATWYTVESACVTDTCTNLNTTTTESMVYSNAGTIRMICGVCGKDRKILSAAKMDPQPEMS